MRPFLRRRLAPVALRSGLGGLALLLGSVLPGELAAQPMNLPTLTTTPPNLPNGLLTAEQRARVENNRPPREYLLEWDVQNAEGRRYRVSFDRDDIRSQAQELVPVIGVTPPEGPAGGRNSIIVSEQALLDHVRANVETFGSQGDLTLHLLVFTVDENPSQVSDVARGTWQFRYDFQPPPAPPVTSVSPGERSLEVRWARPANIPDLQFYEVRFCPALTDDDVRERRTGLAPEDLTTETSTRAFVLDALPCAPPVVRGSIQQNINRITLSQGIEEGLWVAFSVHAVDLAPFFNVSDEAVVYAVRTESAFDFYERHADLGGELDGGFCFVATAAHGSYAHPVVRALRTFRDLVLGNLPFGRAATRLYYEASPPLASAVAADPTAAAMVRPALLVGTALLFALILGVVVAGSAFVVGAVAGRRTRSRPGPLLALLAVTAASAPARAELRPEASGGMGVAFEFKGGPFLPALGRGPEMLDAWREVYGNDRRRVLLNVGLDLQVLRAQHGTLSVGGGVGFIGWNGAARVNSADAAGNLELVSGPDGSSAFQLVPITLTVGYRFDMLMERSPVPLAPYVRAGVAYGLWWNTRDDGGLSRTEVGGEEQLALGGTPGLVGTVGIAVVLNALDRRAAAQLHSNTGIRATYLFIEGQSLWLDGFGGRVFDFSDTTWFAGLSLEL